MAINDPVGDMLTRIRNAQMRRRGNVTTPGSRLRASVLEVLKSEGYIRDFSTTEFGNGRTEFNIELKYFDGEPVIRKVERVSKPGRRVYASVGAMPRVAAGQTVRMKGAKGELSFLVPDEVTVAMENGAVAVNPRDETKTARAKWGMSRAQVANLVEGVAKGFERKLEINGVGYRAQVAGKVLKLSLGYSHDVDYPIPAGITIATPKPTEVLVSGIDKQRVGQTAAEIR